MSAAGHASRQAQGFLRPAFSEQTVIKIAEGIF